MIRAFRKWSLVVTGALTAVLATGAGVWALSAPQGDWKIAGPFGGTAITVAIDPQSPRTVLAGADNSLMFKSDDYGASWTTLDFPKRNLGEVTAILVDPANSAHYLAGALDAFGGGLFESTDAGKNWTRIHGVDAGVRALAASESNPSEFVAGTLKGVMLSNDSGKTWQRISDLNNLEMQGITAVAIDSKDANIIYAGTPHLPWRTTDGGKTWSSIHSGMIDDSDVFSIYVDPKSPAEIFASACSGIYTSADRGDAWKKLVGIPNTSRRTHVIREDPSHEGTIYAGTTMGLFRSPNAGANWKVLTDQQVNSLVFDPTKAGTLYVAMEYEGIGKSLDGGDSIRLANDGFVDRQISSVTRSGNRLVSIETQEGETTGLFVSQDEGSTWAPLPVLRGLAGVHLRSIAGLSSDPKVLLASAPRELFKSTDGGSTWHVVAAKQIFPAPIPVVKHTAVHTRSRTRTTTAAVRKPKPILKPLTLGEINGVYEIRNGMKTTLAMAADNGLYFSEDQGEQWKRAELDNAGDVLALFSSPAGDGRLALKTSQALYISKDAGENWDRLAFPLPITDVNSVAISGDSAAPLLVATRVGLYSSPDGGVKWYANAAGLQASTVSSVTYDGAGQTVFAVEYGRLYKSEDAGLHWTEQPTSLPSVPIRQLWIPDNKSSRLYALTSGMGILFRE